MSKPHGAGTHVFSDSVLCLRKGAANVASDKLTKKWVNHFAMKGKVAGSKPATGDCEPFTVHVPCLSWRYNERAQKENAKVVGIASNTEKLSTPSHAHGHVEPATYFSKGNKKTKLCFCAKQKKMQLTSAR